MSGIFIWLCELFGCNCCCCSWEFFFGSSAPVEPNPQEGYIYDDNSDGIVYL